MNKLLILIKKLGDIFSVIAGIIGLSISGLIAISIIVLMVKVYLML